MKYDFFFWLLICLHISMLIHIVYIAAYIEDKKYKLLRGFNFTSVSTILLGLLLLIVILLKPDAAARFEFKTLLVIESGFVFLFLVFVKVSITFRIIKRSKSLEYYDISFFGKKVYRLEIVKKSELAVYILSMPFTLISGAYFIANVLW